jgi:hypothetical protein
LEGLAADRGEIAVEELALAAHCEDGVSEASEVDVPAASHTLDGPHRREEGRRQVSNRQAEKQFEK